MGNIDNFVKERPTLFPTFKEVEQLNTSIKEIKGWFAAFNRGEYPECFLSDGTYGVHIYPEGHLFWLCWRLVKEPTPKPNITKSGHI